MDPKPSAFHVVHYQPNTSEYDVLADEYGAPVYIYDPEDPPTTDNLVQPDPPDDLTDPEKISELGAYPLVILDEVTRNLKNESFHRIERLLNFDSSHKNTNVICSIQDLTMVDHRHRHAFNQFCLWPFTDKRQKASAATWVGMDPGMLDQMFALCDTDKKQFIWIDTEPSEPKWKYRLCLTEPISKK